MARDSSELTLIDPRAPRTNQALVGLIVVVAFALDAPVVLPALAVVLYAGVLLGRQWIPAYHIFFRVLQPRLGDGALEDERMPRFAQSLGATGLLVSWAFIETGYARTGWSLGLFLAAAAIFAAVTGICLGCLTYRLSAKLRGIAPLRPRRVDPSDLEPAELEGEGVQVVAFTHPLCSECHEWQERIQAEGRPLIPVDVSRRPGLARKYGVALVPTVWEVDGGGRVLRQLTP